jgi:hypothetical protein
MMTKTTTEDNTKYKTMKITRGYDYKMATVHLWAVHDPMVKAGSRVENWGADSGLNDGIHHR